MKQPKKYLRLTYLAQKLVMMIIFCLLPQALKAASPSAQPSLKINPERCVALLQGQACYVTVELKWRVITAGNYCLFSSQQDQPLRCWKNKILGEFKQEFIAKNNIQFFLKSTDNEQPLAQAIVRMAWVHKKKGKPRGSWRMF